MSNDEKTHIAEYDVEIEREVPKLALLDCWTNPQVRYSWELMDPEEGTITTTGSEEIARAFRQVGGVTVERVEEVTYPEPDEVKHNEWTAELRVLAKEHELHYAGREPGRIRVGRYSGTVTVKTPDSEGIEEHVRRRRIVEEFLVDRGLEYGVECKTQHSANVCQRVTAQVKGEDAPEVTA